MSDVHEPFRGILITRDEETKAQSVEERDLTLSDLMDGDVVVRVRHSTVNYKDGLAITGKSPVVRRFPMVPGIDLAGEVVSSDHPDYAPGDEVVLTGWGVGETHTGAYAEYARLKGEWLVKLPPGLTGRNAMAIGTAGFTAMLSIMALERHGILPGRGPVVVTGATGGVGSVATAVLAKLGYHVVAATGRASEHDYLRDLGAGEILDRAELSEKGKPMGAERWAGGVDAVGSTTLANLLAQTQYGGAIAACGLAGGFDLPTTVMPFILRGVSLLGIESVMAPKEIRDEAWARLAADLPMEKLAAMTGTIGLSEVPQAARDILESKVRGRLVVDVA